LRYRPRHVEPRAVRVHHPQQGDHGTGFAADRRDHERAGRLAPGDGRCRRARTHGGDLSMRGVLGLMSALRWTLLILGVLSIAVLAWWERRRPRQARGAV